MKNKIRLVTLCLLTYSSFSFSQETGREKNEEPSSIEEIFEYLDTDGDGNISETEAKGWLKKDFKKIDSNKNGLISKEEIENECKGKEK